MKKITLLIAKYFVPFVLGLSGMLAIRPAHACEDSKNVIAQSN